MTWIAIGTTVGGAVLGGVAAHNAPDQVTSSQGGATTGHQNAQQENFANRAIQGPAGNTLANSERLFQRQRMAGGAPVARGNEFAPQAGRLARRAAVGGLRNSFADPTQQNQFLQGAFDRASNLTQPRLQSEFALAGRDVNAPGLVTRREDELGTIASNLLMPLLENERGRQFSAEENNFGRQFSGANLGLDVGDLQRREQQQRLDAPEEAINRNIDRLNAQMPFFPGRSTSSQQTGGTQVGSATQPVFNDPFGQAVGGAVVGQHLGSRLSDAFGNRRQQPIQQPFNPSGIGGNVMNASASGGFGGVSQGALSPSQVNPSQVFDPFFRR